MKKAVLAFLFAVPCIAQVSNPSIISVTNAPSGSCSSGLPNQQVVSTGVQYSCQSGTWGSIGGGGSGPITPSQVTFPDSSKMVSAAYNTPGIIISPTCPSSSGGSIVTCIQIGLGRMRSDGTSTSTTTVTCPDCNFQCPGSSYPCSVAGAGSDVGNVFVATSAGTGTFPLHNTTFVCPQTTIASVTNSTTAVLNLACTASLAGTAVFYIGPDNGTALAAASANFGCNVVHIASGNGLIFTSQPFGTNQPSSSLCDTTLANPTGAPYQSIVGDGFGASQAMIVLLPNFNWAACNNTPAGARQNVCFGGYSRVLANLQFYGMGLTAAANTNCANGTNKTVVSAWPHSSTTYGVDVAGICVGETGMEGFELNSFDATMDLGGVQDVGQYACYAYGAQNMSMRGNYCSNRDNGSGYGLYINGATMSSWSGYSMDNVFITGATALLSSFFTSYAHNAIEVNGGATFVSYNDSANQLQVDSNSFAQLANSTFASTVSNGGTIVSNGGNTMLGSPGTGIGYWQGADILTGTGSGTCTASTTLYLYGAGQNTIPTCTATATAGGYYVVKVPRSGTIKGLTVVTGGSASAAFNVLVNGSTTGITCSTSSTQFCVDSTHTFTVAAGNLITFQVVTTGTPPSNVVMMLPIW